MGLLGVRVGYEIALVIVTPLLLAGAVAGDRLGSAWRRAWGVFAAAVAFVWGVRIVKLLAARVNEPVEWDFLTFWLGANVANQGLNVYDPAIYQQQTLPLVPSADFVAEILNVGYAYPPTSLLWMYPFGAFSFSTAYALWNVVTVAALLSAAWLLWRTFCPRGGWESGMAVLALLLVLRASFDTFHLGQSQFLLLLLFTVFWRYRDRARGGLFLALSALVKPYMVLLAPWYVLRRSWRVLAGIAAALAAAAVAALALVGPGTFTAYFTERVVNRFQVEVYTQGINQSALAVLLRLLAPDDLARPYALYPPFLAFVVLVTIVMALTTWRGGRKGEPWSLLATHQAAILVYPNSLTHYTVLSALPLLYLWSRHKEIPGGTAALGVFTFLYLVLNSIPAGEFVFLGTLALFLVLAALALRAPTIPASAQEPEAIPVSPARL